MYDRGVEGCMLDTNATTTVDFNVYLSSRPRGSIHPMISEPSIEGVACL